MVSLDSEIVKKSTESQRPSVAHRILGGADRLILRGWRLFTSLKFGIFLLALIGLAAIYGTMGYASNAALGDNSISMARTHFFESKGFVALLLLFAVNLISSTWHVTKMSVGIWWKRDFRRSESYYSAGSSPRGEVAVPEGADFVEAQLRQRFTRVHRDGNAFFAHRGILSRIGPTIVHIGMLVVIGSISAKAWLLWNDRIVTEARFIAAEGETTPLIYEPRDLAQAISPLNQRARNTGLWIKLLDFDEIKFPNSEVPQYFSSLVEVSDPVTNEVTVAQLDMNHSLKLQTRLGALQFHQAGYQKVPEGEVQRVNFDVRDRATGERIAVTDGQVGTRVRVGETDYFLEVDGVSPADRWRVYQASEPKKEIASGLLTGGRKLAYSYRPVRFFTHFTIDPEKKVPVNKSPDIVNPALEVALFLDGRQVESTWLFADKDLANAVPVSHPRFKLELRDVRYRPDLDPAKVEWEKPGEALFVIALMDRQTGAELGQEILEMNEMSPPVEYESKVDHGAAAPLGTEGNFDVRVVGPTDRFLTVLSVVNEPTVVYTNLGVVITVIGALMTFIFRYTAFYGLWDESRKTLRMALVPRWGQSAVSDDFETLVQAISKGRGLLRKGETSAATPDEAPPQHQTVNPSLAGN
ncbi:hypothetical protein GC173_02380 [bacterium]|nr:hypothetical protein [bacterium]